MVRDVWRQLMPPVFFKVLCCFRSISMGLPVFEALAAWTLHLGSSREWPSQVEDLLRRLSRSIRLAGSRHRKSPVARVYGGRCLYGQNLKGQFSAALAEALKPSLTAWPLIKPISPWLYVLSFFIPDLIFSMATSAAVLLSILFS